MRQMRGHFYAALYTVRAWVSLRQSCAAKKSPELCARGLLDFRSRASNPARYFFIAAALSAYFFVKRSTRPAVSTSFCLPVKNGWQFEQISTRICWPLNVERVSNVLPQAQCTFTAW